MEVEVTASDEMRMMEQLGVTEVAMCVVPLSCAGGTMSAVDDGREDTGVGGGRSVGGGGDSFVEEMFVKKMMRF